MPSLVRADAVALTFDDLPLNGTLAAGMTRAGIVTEVLAILKKNHLPQVYGFVNAQKLEGAQDGVTALQRWVTGGQGVGNHTYSHADLNTEDADDFLHDVRQNEPALERLSGAAHGQWFRYPYLREGDTLDKRRAVRSQLTRHGYRIAQVTLDYEDYLWNSAYARCRQRGDQDSVAWLRLSYLTLASQYLDADRQMAIAVFGREIKHVLLLHLGAFSPVILQDLIDLLRRKGFKFVTLEVAQSDTVYESDPDAASAQGGTLLEQWMDARRLPYPDVPQKPYATLDSICR